MLRRLAAEGDAETPEDQRHLEIARLEADLRAKTAAFADPDSTISALELERFRRETRDRIAELRAAPAASAQTRVDLDAAAALLGEAAALWGDPDDATPELQAARRDLMLAVFERVELWGSSVTALVPRPAIHALLEAGAYAEAAPGLARIQIAGSVG